jgi:hypothetical protein
MTVILGYAFPTQAMEMQEAALLRSQSSIAFAARNNPRW